MVEDISPIIKPIILQPLNRTFPIENEVLRELAADPVALIILMIFLGLALGQILKHFSDWTRLPFAPMIILLGIIVSVTSRAKYATITSLTVA